MHHLLKRALPALGLLLPMAVSLAFPAWAETAPASLAPAATDAVLSSPALSPSLPGPTGTALPHDLSPWSMFMAADVVVKSVMIGLALASLATWTIFLVKITELHRARRRVRRLAAVLQDCHSLRDATQAVHNAASSVERAPVDVAATEARLSAGIDGEDSANGLKERIASRLLRMEAAANHRLIKGTGILASIGSTAPFIGLFGTVWGIMNSFIGISQAQTTNLAVVAPGIAEALLATALGLVAAIPAVLIYNAFSRSVSGYRALLADTSAEVMRLVSRDLDRHALPLRMAAE